MYASQHHQEIRHQLDRSVQAKQDFIASSKECELDSTCSMQLKTEKQPLWITLTTRACAKLDNLLFRDTPRLTVAIRTIAARTHHLVA